MTRDHGGSLGAMSAAMLPGAFLDALEQTPAGQVSNVVETQLGFHILLRRSPPPREQLAGQRIVIRYAGTFGDRAAERSRTEALALARQAITRARQGADFDALVAELSEGMDRDRGGGMGVWSTTEAAPDAHVIAALAELPVGGVTLEPIDTHLGFQVLKRVEPGTRTELEARVVSVSFDPTVDAEQTAARTRIEALKSVVGTDPMALAQLPDAERVRWTEGHGDPQLTTIVEAIEPGAIAGPVRWHDAFALVARVDPALSCKDPAPGSICRGRSSSMSSRSSRAPTRLHWSTRSIGCSRSSPTPSSHPASEPCSTRRSRDCAPAFRPG